MYWKGTPMVIAQKIVRAALSSANKTHSTRNYHLAEPMYIAVKRSMPKDSEPILLFATLKRDTVIAGNNQFFVVPAALDVLESMEAGEQFAIQDLVIVGNYTSLRRLRHCEEHRVTSRYSAN